MSEDIILEVLNEKAHCGSVFLTDAGCLIYECSICRTEYECHNDYWTHVMEIHYLTRPDVVFSAEDLQEIEEDNASNEGLEERPAALKGETDDLVEDIIEEIEKSDCEAEAESNLEVFDDQTFDEKLAETQCTDPSKDQSVATEDMIEFSENSFPKIERPAALIETSRSIRQALLRHAKNVKCPKCGKILKDMVRLRVHLKRHLRILRFTCEICQKGFIDRPELNLHMRRHNNERPFLCVECGMAFYSSGALTEHVKRRHTDARNFPCTECNWKFKSKSMLKKHMVKHTQEKNYLCTQCDAKFPRRTSLLVHMKIHENRREYACQLCDADFNQKAGLYSHMRTRHKTITEGKENPISEI